MDKRYIQLGKISLSLLLIMIFGMGLLTLPFCTKKSLSETEKKAKEKTDLHDINKERKNKSAKQKGSLDQYRENLRREKTIKKQKLTAIDKIEKAQNLSDYVQDPDSTIRRAAISRLGEIGGNASVDLLYKTFQKEPRIKGVDVPVGLKGNVIDALVHSAEKKAGDYIILIAKDLIQIGPLEKGSYSHIFDVQYYGILNHALDALKSFPNSNTKVLLKSIRDNSSLFYVLRESAWESLMVIEMKEKNISSQHDQIYNLLSQIDHNGVFVEKRWEKPGKKTLAAINENVLEELVIQKGWEAVDFILSYMKNLNNSDFPHKTACARILSSILLEKLSEKHNKTSIIKEKKVFMIILEYLYEIPDKMTSSETIIDIYDSMKTAADIFKNQTFWNKVKTIGKKLDFPGEWKGESPSEQEIKLPLPKDSIFIKSLSSRVKTKQGTISRTYFVCNKNADDVVSHFERCTGKKSQKKEIYLPSGQKEIYYGIKFGRAPEEFAVFIDFGVTIIDSPLGFQEKSFGQIINKGKTLFRITTIN